MSFWGELKRRNVVKVGAAYAIVAWLIVQVAAAVLPNFDAPRWIVQTVVFLLVLGFPVALLLAWAYEVTPEARIFSMHSSVPAAPRSTENGNVVSWSIAKEPGRGMEVRGQESARAARIV